MSIYYDTGMDKMPDSCANCKMFNCNLPTKRNRPEELCKAYMTHRHKSCPLVEVTRKDG